MSSIYDYSVYAPDGREISLADYKGKVLVSSAIRLQALTLR